jgi:hypothetical protein
MMMTDEEIQVQAQTEIMNEFFPKLQKEWDWLKSVHTITLDKFIAERCKVIQLKSQSRLAELMADGNVMSLVETIQLRVGYGYYVRYWQVGEIIETRCKDVPSLITELEKLAGE